jgi:quercetin dioxygenase-like cupin family protein
VVSGRLRIVTVPHNWTEPVTDEYGPGDMACEEPGIPHAWQALADTTVLVFSRGPRSGEAYESDTVRLAEGERLL